MEIQINAEEIFQEMQRQFPKETQICVQAVQIRKMSELIGEAIPEDEEVSLEVVEDASI